MCGIAGYAGSKQVTPVLIGSLKRMEYRGYDSAGIAIVNNGSIAVLKDSGRVDWIAEKISNRMTEGNLGIAHTRWATHGEVSQDNAHPHTSCNGEVAVVHNGIIENFQELVATLRAEGHHFRSQTDSEVIAHLLERSYQRLADPVKALQEALRELIGSYALVVVFHDRPDLMLGARKDAPLIVGVGNGENFIASDILAFIDHTDRVIFLEELEMVTVTSQSVELMKLDGTRIDRKITHVAWEAADVSKEEFAHHTLKEIHEQTRSLRTALLQDEKSLDSFVSNIKNAKNLYITSCGSSFNIGLLLKHLLTKLCKIPAQAFVSSESDEYIDLMDRDTVVIAISQSGETADLLKAVSDARGRGAKVLSIVNSVGSTLSRKSSVNLYLNCGPEVGVAATKSFTSQLVLVYEVIFRIAGMHSKRNALRDVSSAIEQIFMQEEKIRSIAGVLKLFNDVYFIGRGPHYPIALEGALKLKELSYIHAEGMAAGELKHGTLALIDKGTPAVVINPHDETFNDTLSNASEMRARGATVVGISSINNELYDYWIPIPETDPFLQPILEVLPLQLLAYYTALERHNDPDHPRNLAKSVTVK